MANRIAIAIEDGTGNTEIVAEHFGRCSKFVIHELGMNNETLRKETYFNPLAGHGNGTCQLPGYIKQFDVNLIIAGGMGQKAISNFNSFGIEVITAPGLEAEHALSLYLQQKLSGYTECAGHNHNC
jgi:predicted Fe-Mo cluster-binding NifX family protein